MTDTNLQKWVQKLWGDDPITEELEPVIKRLITPIIVELEHMQQIHEWLDMQRLSKQPGRIVAPPRAGKSITCDVYRLLNKPQKKPGRRDIVPVLYLQAPGDCSVGELLGLILELLKYGATTGKVTELRKRVQRVLKESQVEMIIIDEANFLKLNTFSEIARIYDLLKISIILVGTDGLDNLIKRNEYIHDRFIECYRFDVISEKKFPKMVEIWEREVADLPLPSNLSREETLKPLYIKTGGKLGLLDKVIRKAAILSLKKGLKSIDKATLHEVLERFE
ncbi:TniB family NTP-binding protein [Funiculus sociatus GB2-A5]|uniref:TniB family NTP-binding protein n=1 Tax=Funiculus sociatus GB2-A5 TaxID=2933946 RepID=A0ABV0JY81_9CYAN|nr:MULTISPECIES: TniB family NTP-binding protein [unclassified Trichocoleus]MBD1906339.1 TniB family NTP-binding protein [Trichocoleus sp. FACHB-832]MBD2062836.1 TniB family NTP-binding protein [Trichocoleus sp. FACHB-6]